jgi:homoserine O-acetyltransferase
MSKISSPVGHDAFLTETKQLDRIMRHFLKLADDDFDDIEYYL